MKTNITKNLTREEAAVALSLNQPFPKMKNPAAVALGKLGGSKKSEAKTKTARENGKKGGRPKRSSRNGVLVKPTN